MADHAKPSVTSTYVNYTSELNGRIDDSLKMLDPATTTPTNIPTNAIRYNSVSFKWQKWNGTAWSDISIDSTTIKNTPAGNISSTTVQGAINELDTEKQATLISGNNIKTINSTTLLGNGNIAVQATLESGTNIKTINSISLLGSGNVAVQATLESGTNIKSINSTSLLGSGDIVLPVVPSGTVIHFASSSAPSGFLKANGAAISRTTYSALFTIIGTTFGEGDGSTTFNLPDLRGTFTRNYDDGRGVDGGRGFGTWQDSANKSHNHGGGTGGISNGHTHKLENLIWMKYDGSSQDCGVIGGPTQFDRYTSDVTANHWHGINNDGLAEARPTNIALLACIKY